MATRKETLYKLKNHPYYGPFFKKMKANDMEIILDFLSVYGQSTKDEFASAATRLFLGSKVKPKNLGLIVDLLMACNSKAVQ